jgi:hypothetical protein
VDAGAVDLDAPDLDDEREDEEGNKKKDLEDDEAEGEDATFTEDEEKNIFEVEKEIMVEFEGDVDARNVRKFDFLCLAPTKYS